MEPSQRYQFISLTEQVINPSVLSKNPGFYHPCCYAFNKRMGKSTIDLEEPEYMQDLRNHDKSIMLSKMFPVQRDQEGNPRPWTPTEAWETFITGLYGYGVTNHDYSRPFVVNQKICLKKLAQFRREDLPNQTFMAMRAAAIKQEKDSQINILESNNAYLERDNRRLENHVAYLNRRIKGLKRIKKNSIIRIKHERAMRARAEGQLSKYEKVGPLQYKPTFVETIMQEASDPSLSVPKDDEP